MGPGRVAWPGGALALLDPIDGSDWESGVWLGGDDSGALVWRDADDAIYWIGAGQSRRRPIASSIIDLLDRLAAVYGHLPSLASSSTTARARQKSKAARRERLRAGDAKRLAAIEDALHESGRQMNPPAGSDDVTTFERAHGVALPAPYREFLVRVANGGEGPPEYGMVPLGARPVDWTGAETRPATAFPLRAPWLWEDGDEGPDDVEREDIWNGVVHLGTDGCGLYYVLVVSGPERGKVWIHSDVGTHPLEPVADFLAWIERWLGLCV